MWLWRKYPLPQTLTSHYTGDRKEEEILRLSWALTSIYIFWRHFFRIVHLHVWKWQICDPHFESFSCWCWECASEPLTIKTYTFLDAWTHLYKRLCPSISPWVGPLVRNPLTKNAILARNSIKFKKILLFSHILDASLFVSNLLFIHKH